MYVCLQRRESLPSGRKCQLMPRYEIETGAVLRLFLLIFLAMSIIAVSLVLALDSASLFSPHNHSLSIVGDATEPELGSESEPVHATAKNMSIRIRPVERGDADLEAIVDIVIQAFDYDPQWQWRYPYRKEYPEDHYYYTRTYYADYLDMTFAGHNTIMLAEMPSDEDHSTLKVVAVSIWDNYGSAPPDPNLPGGKPPVNHPERRDASATRMAEYSRCSAKARRKLFVARYGERQLSLRQMATLPTYWRRGAATMLCRWGMNEARRVGVAVPMFASPMGRRVYEALGFKKIGQWKAQLENEEESVTIHALTWEPGWEDVYAGYQWACVQTMSHSIHQL